MQLDETSTRILRYIKDNRPAKIEDIIKYVSNKSLAENCVLSLKSKKLIRGLTPVTYHTPSGIQCADASPYEITADGLAYLDSLEMQEKQELHEKKLKKMQFRHNWKIAIFNTIGGAIAGFITSLIFWLLTK